MGSSVIHHRGAHNTTGLSNSFRLFLICLFVTGGFIGTGICAMVTSSSLTIVIKLGAGIYICCPMTQVLTTRYIRNEFDC